MVYDHIVKVNGRYYQTGEDVPEIKEDKQYTKTEINRMSTAELQNLAAAEGIENAFDTSGNELKKILTEHFGL